MGILVYGKFADKRRNTSHYVDKIFVHHYNIKDVSKPKEGTMKRSDLGGYGSVNRYVREKVKRLHSTNKTFSAIYELMFSEEQNIFAEKTDGYKIIRKTYGESRADTEKFARKLCAATQDLEYGSIVGLYMQNSAEWVEALWAILKCGFVPLLMNTRMEEERLADVLQENGVPLVLSDGKTFACKTLIYSEVCASETEKAPSKWADELIVMSSGTSAQIKLCVYRGANFADQIEDSANIIAQCKHVKKFYDGSLKLLAFLPLYHIFGLAAMYMWFGFFARTFVFLKDYNPDTILRTVRKHKVTHIFAVPLVWNKIYATFQKKLAERGEKTVKKFNRGYRISKALGGGAFARLAFKEVRDNIFGESVQFMITGGGAISPEVLSFFNSIGYHLANGYGMSEVGITSVETSSRARRLNSGSIGMPFTHVEYSIDETGELLVRGSSVASKILCAGETITLNGQWYHTKDLARTEKGHVFLLGRKDDMLVGADGENINPDWVESRMFIQGALGFCLVGVHQGEEIIPTLVVQVNSFATEKKLAEIRERAEAELTKLALAGSVHNVVLTDVPLLRENDFKVNRRRIAEALERGELRLLTELDVAAHRNEDALYCRMRAIFAVVLGKEESEIGDDMHFFFDLGGSSLDYLAMVTAVRNEFNVSFPTTSERSLSTVKEFCEFIQKDL